MSKLINILVVDDLPKPRRYMHKKLCSNPQWSVDLASSEKEAVQKINDNHYDIIVTDMYMEERNSGLNVLYAAKKKDKLIEVIIITGYASIQETVEAMREGAFHYINKDDKTPYALMYKIVEDAVKKIQEKLYDVFIAYNNEDKERVKNIVDILKKRGEKIFFADHDMSPGDKICHEIREVIKKVDYAIFCICDNGLGDYQKNELKWCIEESELREDSKKLIIIPLILDNSTSGYNLPDELNEFLAVDFRLPINRLIDALKK